MSDATVHVRPQGYADGLGVFLSHLCLAHCFFLPALLAVLPSLDFHALPGGETLHFAILLLATPTAIYALLSGYRYHHKASPFVVGALGLTLLWSGSALEVWHTVVSHHTAHSLVGLGSVLLVFAHLANRWKVKRTVGHCGCAHQSC